MKVLFVHQSFPGQFKHLAPALVAGGHDVRATLMQKQVPDTWNGIRLTGYLPVAASTPGIHPWLKSLENETILAESVFRTALKLKASGYNPDVIVAHPGWGESTFLKHVWPQTRLGIYCEYFYHHAGMDVGFDPEFSVTDVGEKCRLQLKNLNILQHFGMADAGISPTYWQAATFPEPFRHKISVVHDGIDTGSVRPDPLAQLRVATECGELLLTREDEVITYVSRNLEPYRGYHVFMRALPELLRRRPHAHVLITGGEGVSYGQRPAANTSWKQVMINEVRPGISNADWSRVHFTGVVPYSQFIKVLQLSTVHVYLTYPFVLGWSLLEAMSAGCAIVASDTGPLHEAVQDGETGRRVGFFDIKGLVNTTCELLEQPEQRRWLGTRARKFVCNNYDLHTLCLPRQIRWVETLSN
jgi:glycosyltransferase involved in cell wall biosynthesis